MEMFEGGENISEEPEQWQDKRIASGFFLSPRYGKNRDLVLC